MMTSIKDQLQHFQGLIEDYASKGSDCYQEAGNAESAADDAAGAVESLRRNVSDLDDALGELRDEFKTLVESLGDYDDIYSQTELDEAVAKAVAEVEENATFAREPLRERGIAINVRYGYIPGEDDEHGPTLRCDVNCDGRWLLARLAGRQLGRFLKESGLTDVQYLTNRTVEIVTDEQLAWRIDRLVPESEVAEEVAETLKEMEQEVEVVVMQTPHTWRGAETVYVPIGARFTYAGGDVVHTVTRKAEPGQAHGFFDEEGTFWQGSGLELIRPVTFDKGGHPVYPGDHISFDDGSSHISGVVLLDTSAHENWSVRRDDGERGGGQDGAWLIHGASNVRKLAPAFESGEIAFTAEEV